MRSVLVCLLLVVAIAMVAVGAALAVDPPDGAPGTPEGYSITEAEGALVNAMNAYRAKFKRPPLRVHWKLMAAAQRRAERTRDARWMHAPGGESFMVTISRAGYRARSAAENCAWEFPQNPMSEAAKSWAQSPGHAKNMRGDYADVGVGCAEGTYRGQQGWIIYAIFGNE